MSVKVDASAGAVSVGDYLCAGPTLGVAVKAVKPGPVIGTALKGLSDRSGRIMVFVSTGWYGGYAGNTEDLVVRSDDPEDPDSGVSIEPGAPRVKLALDGANQSAAGFSVVSKQPEGAAEPEVVLLSVQAGRGVYARGSYGTTGLGYAEYHPVTEPVEVGDVLSAALLPPGSLKKADIQEDPAVVGVVLDNPALMAGEYFLRAGELFPELKDAYLAALAAFDQEDAAILRQQLEFEFLQNFAPVAFRGTVACKVDASFGAIAVGDLLASSPTPGHAMRVDVPTLGTIVGKALEPMSSGQGAIRMLLMPRLKNEEEET